MSRPITAGLCIYLSCLMLALFDPGSAYSSKPSKSSLFDPPPVFSGPVYADETIFVKFSAEIGNIIGSIAGGIAGAVIGIPVGLVTAPFLGGTSIFYFPVVGAHALGTLGGYAGAAISGFPFYVLQKIFYDFPKWLIFSDSRVEKPDEASVSSATTMKNEREFSPALRYPPVVIKSEPLPPKPEPMIDEHGRVLIPFGGALQKSYSPRQD